MSLWRRWLNYTTTRIRMATRATGGGSDRPETEPIAEPEASPSSDDMKFEIAKRERAAQLRLEKIRDDLDAGDGKKPT
jgi:hypothetical protein